MAPRAGLSTDRVVEAAAAIIDTEGAAALTINRLAARLKIQPPSLYNHINGLAGLWRELALLSTRDLGERLTRAAVGQSGDAAMLGLAQAYRAYILEHPGLYAAGIRGADSLSSDMELLQAQERVVSVVLAVVASFGLSGVDGLHAVRILRGAIHGFATLEAAGGFGLPLDCDESFHRLLEVLMRGLSELSVEPD